MRPDSVAGGAACIVAAVGLLSASYLSLMVPWNAVEVAICKQVSFDVRPRVPCHTTRRSLRGDGDVVAGSGDDPLAFIGSNDGGVESLSGQRSMQAVSDEDTNCFRLLLEVVVLPIINDIPSDSDSFPGTVTPHDGAACVSTTQCMDVLTNMNSTFSCYVLPPGSTDEVTGMTATDSGPPIIIEGTPSAQLLAAGQPGWKAKCAFGFLVLVPIPFCIFMGVFLLYSGITETNPLKKFMQQFSCDMVVPGVEKNDAHVL